MFGRFPGSAPAGLKKYKAPQTKRNIYEYSVRGLAARNLCAALLPYSVVKREQLELALQFYEQPWRSQRTTRNGGGYKLRTVEQVDADLGIARQMKELKHASGQ